MWLSGLNNVDFSGIGAGDPTAVDLDTAVDKIWDLAPIGTSLVIAEEDFKNNFRRLFGNGYQFVRNPAGDAVSSAEIADIADAAKFASRGEHLSDTERNGTISLFNKVQKSGLYLVKTGATVAVPVADNAAPAVQSAAPGVASRDQGVRAQASSGQQTVYANRVMQPQPAPSLGLPRASPAIHRVIRPHRQTLAEKQRLLWIIGGFGVALTIALGLIAASD